MESRTKEFYLTVDVNNYFVSFSDSQGTTWAQH